MKLRIVIDAHMVGARETGNEAYVLGLLHGLARVNREHEFLVLTLDPGELARRIALPPGFTAVRVRPRAGALRVPIAMPRLARKLKADVLHVTYVAPPFCPCPTVVTVHDITFRLFPRFFSLRDRLLLRALVPLSVRRAARVIAISECTKKDLVSHMSVDPGRVAVTPLAASERFAPVEDPRRLDALRAGLALRDPFILTVSNLQPRKNLETLLAAFAELRSSGGLEVQLAVAGQPWFRAGETYERARRLGVERDVRFLGYVPEEDLKALYSAARVFAFPSLYEGFGLPPLEAMACGTPVISSNGGALAETVGEAGLLLAPEEPSPWARALRAVLTDPGLRSRLRDQGLSRARQFSWEDTAARTLRVYEQAAARKP